MLNLDEVELVPLKTRGKTRDGSVLIYLGKVNSAWPYCFLYDNQCGFIDRVEKNGFLSYSENQKPGDIISVYTPRRWEPQVGDVVFAYGYNRGSTTHFNGTGECTITGLSFNGNTNLLAIDYLGEDCIVHRRQLKFVRRPPSG